MGVCAQKKMFLYVFKSLALPTRRLAKLLIWVSIPSLLSLLWLLLLLSLVWMEEEEVPKVTMLYSQTSCRGNWQTWLPPSNMAALICSLLHLVEKNKLNMAQSTQDVRANSNIFPLMLLACSVDTPIHINRSHLLVSCCASRPASCVDWAHTSLLKCSASTLISALVGGFC